MEGDQLLAAERDVESAAYIDKIANGAHPAGLPVEEPTVFELIINLKAAQTMGITIPPALLLRADRLIE